MRRLGSVLGPEVRADWLGSCSPATEEFVGPPAAAGLARCLAYHRFPGQTASCLEQEGSAAKH